MKDLAVFIVHVPNGPKIRALQIGPEKLPHSLSESRDSKVLGKMVESCGIFVRNGQIAAVQRLYVQIIEKCRKRISGDILQLDAARFCLLFGKILVLKYSLKVFALLWSVRQNISVNVVDFG